MSAPSCLPPTANFVDDAIVTSTLSCRNALNPDLRRPVLVTITYGEFAKLMERLTQSEAVAACMKTLQKMFGKDIPAPTFYQVTAWHSNPCVFVIFSGSCCCCCCRKSFHHHHLTYIHTARAQMFFNAYAQFYSGFLLVHPERILR